MRSHEEKVRIIRENLTEKDLQDFGGLPETMAWLEGLELAQKMTLDEIFDFVNLRSPLDRTPPEELARRQTVLSDRAKDAYTELTARLSDEGKNTGQSIVILHHMLLFAVTSLLAKGLCGNPEAIRRLVTRVKLGSIANELEEFLGHAPQKKEKEADEN